MKRILVIGIILLFIGMSISSSTGFNAVEQSIKTLNGKTLYVGGSGPGNYSKIQDAIDDASDGDTVFVFDDSSPYYENLIINKTINLIGEDRNTTIIDSSGKDGASIFINADGIYLSGFNLKNSRCGVEVLGNNNSITRNIIINNDRGIYIWGFGRHSGNNISITDNIIKNNRRSGIWLNGTSNNNTLSRNIINSSLFGVGLSYMAHFNIIMGNVILNNSYYGIYIDSNHNMVANNVISNNTRGIAMHNKSNEIFENLLTNNDHGIRVDYWYNNSIYHNNFINNINQAYDTGNNTWDDGYPSGGNYWDDYTGNDSDGDGIGDTPYPIPGGDNEDRYPLMEQWNGSYNRPYGPSKGLVGVDYTFCYDLPYNPDGDSYIVMWYWGDGDSSEWLGPYEPGETVCANHKWGKPGNYVILVITRDLHGSTYWSEPWIITIVNITNLDVDIQVKFPGKISAHIRNVGNDTAINVNYSITVRVKGILFGLGTTSKNGTFDKLPPESEHIWTISKGLIIGFGWFNIIVSASAFNAEEVSKELKAFVFLFFIRLNPGGRI